MENLLQCGGARFYTYRYDAGSNSDQMLENRSKAMPLGRFTEPLEISYAVAWLASRECDMVTGQVISPNSGEVIVGY